MKITNKHDMHPAIYNAILNDPYSSGDCDASVTQLLKPPRQVALEELHWESLEEDAMDRMWSLQGRLMHKMIEENNTIGKAERRLSMMVDGWKISGGMDHFHDGALIDFKYVTSYKFKDVALPQDWIHQLNIYSEMIRQNGEEVKSATIIGILRDWSKMEANREPSYPQCMYQVREIPLWPSDKVQAFVLERVKMHKMARITLPECNEEDRWQRPTKWAVMKAKNKRAVKLHESEEFANAQAATDKDLWVQKRPGDSIKCRFYCNISKFCDQWKKEQSTLTEGELNEV